MIDSIKIRMYRHGFGDCFLLRFFSGKVRQCSMLIDCGLKKNDSVEGVTLEDVRDDISRLLRLGVTGNKKPRLDILVVTHEHWDHVSGFHPAKKLFNVFSVDKLWLAWTEDPDDEDAKVLNKGLQKRIKALKIATDRLKKNTNGAAEFYMSLAGGDKLLAIRKDFNDSLEGVLEFLGPLAVTKTPDGATVKEQYRISLDTQLAMDHIRTLANGKETGIRYCSPGDLIEDKTGLPGVRIYVFGPPRNKLLNKAAPSGGAKKEVYFGDSSLAGFVDGVVALEEKSTRATDCGRPFGNVPAFSIEQAKDHKYLTMEKGYLDPGCNWRAIQDDWLDMAGGLAMQMDSDTNNTSLVLAIEMIDSGKVLLFPGDAQVGNWLSWHDYVWTVKSAGSTKTVNAEQLLNNTVFYKVGHHSSHNATLKEKGLEMMTHDDLEAFVPEKEGQYSGIPYTPLIQTLKKKTKGRLIVSADSNYPAESTLKNRPLVLSAKEWKAFSDSIELEPLFVEYTIRG